MEALRALPSPAVMLRRQVAAFRTHRLGLPPREAGGHRYDGTISASDAAAVRFWLHEGLSPCEIALATGLSTRAVSAFLSASLDPVHTAESARVRGLAMLGDYWPRASTGTLDA